MANLRTPVVFTAYNTGQSVAQLSTTARSGTYSNNFIQYENWWVADKPLIPETGDFTLEFWHHQDGTTDRTKYYMLFRQALGAVNVLPSENCVVIDVSSGYYRILVSSSTGSLLTITSGAAANSWTHLALVRSGSILTFYVNGRSRVTNTNFTGNIPQVNSYIGGGRTGMTTVTQTVPRLIDEFRASSIARYTSNFTPDISYINDTDTLALLRMETIPPVDDAEEGPTLPKTDLSAAFVLSASPTFKWGVAPSLNANFSLSAAGRQSENLEGYSYIQSNLFVEIDVPDYQKITCSDYHKNYTIGSTTYQGLGNLIAITDNSTSLRAVPDEIALTISGIPSSNVSEILDNKIKGSVVKIYRAFFDPVTAALLPLTLNPIGKFQGVVSNFDISDDLDSGSSTGTVTLTLTLTSVVELLEDKIAGRRTNARDFSNEKSMDRVALLSKANFNFGAPA